MNSLKSVLIILIVIVSGTIISAQDVPEPAKVYEPAEEAKVFGEYLRMSADEEKEYLKNASAQIKEYFKQIKETDENRYYSLLREYYFSSMRYPLMRKTEADMQKVQKEIIENEIMTEALAGKYKKAKSNEKDRIKTDLEKSLTNLFDLKEKQREIEVGMLERQLKELKDKLNMRKQNKSTIIKRRIEELLGNDKYLEWE